MKKHIFIVLIFIIQVGFSQSKKNIVTELDTINNIYIPKNLKDCFKQINIILSDSIKKKIMNQSESEFTINSHFGFGLWIRNNWGLWRGSRLYIFFNKKGLNHPDDMSAVILTSYHRYINGKRIKLKKQINSCKEYWENPGVLKKFVATTFNKELIYDIKLALSKADSIFKIELIAYKKIPREFKKFKFVKSVSIKKCQKINIKKAIKKLRQNKSLEKLYFFSNHQTKYPNNIGKFKNLKSLWISGDSIREVPVSIVKLRNLESLNITKCENIDVYKLLNTIKDIKNLRKLNLSNNNLKTIPKNIRELKQLKILWLDGNHLIKISNEVKSLQNLEYLFLFSNDIEHLDFTKNDLINLKNINLCYNKFKTFPIELANLRKLEKVIMWYSEISNIPKNIEKLKNLKYLNISNNKLTQKQIELIKEKLPNTEIID